MKWMAVAAAAAFIMGPAGAKAATYTLTEDQFYSGTLYPAISPVSGYGLVFFPATPGQEYKVTVTDTAGLISGLIDETFQLAVTDYYPPPIPPSTDTIDSENPVPLILSASGTMLSLDYAFPADNTVYDYYQGMLAETEATQYFPQIGIFALVTAFDPNQIITIEIDPIPEPATYGLMALGLGFAGAMLRRQRSRASRQASATA